ncbi:MAG TPA: response regulator, partial [Giesbergeria sp.]|nr:response regulator [Giesbergeria sp.]
MRILLVEDDRPLAQAVLGYLQAKQFSVDWAENLQQARALVAVTHYSAVLLDLNLPDGEGLQLLPALASTAAAQESRPTVIVVTARDQVSDRIRGLDAGADDYL